MFIQPFGPEIFNGIVPTEISTALENLTYKNENDLRKRTNKTLLGFVSKQIDLYDEPELKDQILPTVNNLVLNYLQNNSQYSNKIKTWHLRDFNCTSCWSNIQQPKEFLPAHNHPVDIVCIIYPKISISCENLYECNDDAQSGQLTFYYGEGSVLFTKISFSVIPKTGTILIFPGWLKHASYPIFGENDIRISTSFNFIFSEYLRMKIV